MKNRLTMQFQVNNSRRLGTGILWTGLIMLFGGFGSLVFAEADGKWQVVGQQGIVNYVIVPESQATDLAAYEDQLAQLCHPQSTCFVNFYTNSTGATPALPLPDAISGETAAIYRQSMKNGMRGFRWSCRLQPADANCF